LVHILLLVPVIGLSACTVTPLYSAAPDGTTMQAELAAISVLPAANRLTQIVRNELVFAFGGGAEPEAPIYELSLSASSGSGPDVPGTNVPLTRLAVTVRYTLIELGSGAVIASGTASVETSFQLSNQGFANLRAREDAEARAAVAAADRVRLAIISALAAGAEGASP